MTRIGTRLIVGSGICLALAAMFASAATAGPSAGHTVTVQVSAMSELTLTGGNVTLTVGAATAGQQPDSETSTACALAWTANPAHMKITVATSLVSPTFGLKVLAQSVTGGTAAPEVTLSNTAANFISGAGETVGRCTLRYAAWATAAQGTGSDAHTVTYTLSAE